MKMRARKVILLAMISGVGATVLSLTAKSWEDPPPVMAAGADPKDLDLPSICLRLGDAEILVPPWIHLDVSVDGAAPWDGGKARKGCDEEMTAKAVGFRLNELHPGAEGIRARAYSAVGDRVLVFAQLGDGRAPAQDLICADLRGAVPDAAGAGADGFPIHVPKGQEGKPERWVSLDPPLSVVCPDAPPTDKTRACAFDMALTPHVVLRGAFNEASLDRADWVDAFRTLAATTARLSPGGLPPLVPATIGEAEAVAACIGH